MTDTISIPRLRFKDFTDIWEKKQVLNICELISGQHLSPNEYDNTLSDTPYFTGPSDFTNNQNELSKWSLVGSKVAINGDILITVKGSGVGEMMLLKLPKVAMGRQLMAIRSMSENDIRYIYFGLTKNKRLFEALASGNMIPGLSRQDILQTKMFVPSYEEQKKVADFLTSVDKKISLLKDKHALLTQYKKGVMRKLFKQDIRFKDDNGNAFPDWQTKPLSKLADKNSLKNKDNAVNAVLTNSAKSGIVNQGDYFNKDIANQGNLTGYTVVEKNDFIYNPRISELAPVGPIKRNHIGQGVMSPLYTAFRFKDESVLDYVEQYFNTTMWHRYMHSIANFGARHDRMNITSADFYALPLPMPSEAEREKIVDFIKALEAKVSALNEQIELTQIFKKGLLQQMFV